ncbi:nuclear transport factor 2 family protein [Pseudoalteromonas sp. 1CM17D]|uniref:nuclear transport factor 2 family protein n=1 Tax=Pseudoalteromonas sp. 1CM17D TaxID=2929162 RepID=UPI0020BE22C3|nr:nuclear transport factor 2 family protein [Pseudoalteromonas sp. 1CM17D]MCK8097206.1 nuclear transport factor 2 family protein [Pseudoalteromonas sp. 1CM17D]
MKYSLLLLITLLSFDLTAKLQIDNEAQITQTLQNYITGTSYNEPDLIKRAFAKEARLLLSKKGQEIWPVSPNKYASWFKDKRQFNGRIGEILSIDFEGDIATAKVEILIPEKSIRYVDLFLLKKISGNWKVVSKAATSETSEQSGKRILFIVSNAHFHGDSKLPTGVSFSEIVKAYDTFKKAGYTIDFVSPEGGAIPLAYINTSEEIHKQYLYEPDFMYAIKNTKQPSQIDPANYLAVHYVGGGNAMYGVADNVAIQKIAMTIYEEQQGIVSSVCHGTAGIVNLKTKEGKYLVAGKRISGYPDSYENQSRAYFKEFPFLIQKTIESRGGQFFYSARNTPHVEVDGRIVTGQNHLSSSLVAQKMVEILQQN